MYAEVPGWRWPRNRRYLAIGNHRKTIGKPWENHRKMMENGGLPFGYVKIAIENGHRNS
jgi:hypothetical protein